MCLVSNPLQTYNLVFSALKKLNDSRYLKCRQRILLKRVKLKKVDSVPHCLE